MRMAERRGGEVRRAEVSASAGRESSPGASRIEVIKAWPKDSRTTWHGGEIDCSHSETAGASRLKGGREFRLRRLSCPYQLRPKNNASWRCVLVGAQFLARGPGRNAVGRGPLTGDGQTQFTGAGNANASQSGEGGWVGLA